MITKKHLKDGRHVTFAVEDERPLSVVGDFNGWDPYAHPLFRRSDGTRSVARTDPTGTTLFFRYLADGGEFYDDPHADVIDPNGMGSTHGVVDTAVAQALAP